MSLTAHIFTSPKRTIGSSGLTYPPTTSTLVTGERDAVLIDTQFLKGEIAALGDLIERSGKRLTTIYVTHAHGDHSLGLGRLLGRFPAAEALAIPPVAARLNATLTAQMPLYQSFFGDAVAEPEVLPSAMDSDVIAIDGEELRVISVGQGDIPDSTVVHIPSIDTVVAGDVAYNRIHPMLAEQNDEQMGRWLASLDAIERLAPAVVVAGHKQQDASDADVATIIGGTRSYIRDFREAVATSTGADEVVATLTAKYPDYDNCATLLISARARFRPEGESVAVPSRRTPTLPELVHQPVGDIWRDLDTFADAIAPDTTTAAVRP